MSAARRWHGWLRPRTFVLLACALFLLFLPFSGRWLVVNNPEPSDTILVLDGEYDARPAGALRALREGLAPSAILDVDNDPELYGMSVADLAQRWLAGLPASERDRFSLCVTDSNSTKQEARRALACLGPGIHRVLLVTSDYHSRRALSVFRHTDPGRRYSMFAVSDPSSFGVDWWRRREWAKQAFESWSRLIWWELVDRWFNRWY